MSMLSWYILVGLCSCLYFEAVAWLVAKYGRDKTAKRATEVWNDLGVLSKLTMFAVWPISIIIFIVALVRAYFK